MTVEQRPNEPPVLELLDPGLGTSIQDEGRWGWRRFGIPTGGAMDTHAYEMANRLLGNTPGSPMLELLLQGASFRVLEPVWVVVAGADAACNIPMWRAVRLGASKIVGFPRHRSGVWIYLAVEGGFQAPRVLGSASIYARGRLGHPLPRGALLRRGATQRFLLPSGVAGRAAIWSERRDYHSPPELRVWPGAQWEDFSDADREDFFRQDWKISPRSDRVGYRLEGSPLKPRRPEILSEPVRLGTVQVPENGQPIITMRDGPTVGGYPKLGLVEGADLTWLAQCPPGQSVRFVPAD